MLSRGRRREVVRYLGKAGVGAKHEDCEEVLDGVGRPGFPAKFSSNPTENKIFFFSLQFYAKERGLKLEATDLKSHCHT